MVNERLKELRKTNNVTQKHVANSIDIAVRHYQDLEYGKVKPSHDTIIALANFFGVSTDYLLGLTDNPKRL